MPKRFYSSKDPELYQYKDGGSGIGGNYYIRRADKETCLQTDIEDEAIKAKAYHNVLVTTYGIASFNSKFDLFPKYLVYLNDKVKRKRLKKSYVKSIEWTWKTYLKDFWEDKRLVDFNQKNWTEFCKVTQRQSNISDFKNPRITMTSFLSWAQRDGLILMWPKVENPDHQKRKRKIVKPEHIVLIFQYAPSVNDWRMARRKDLDKRPRKTSGKKIAGGLRLFLALYLFQGMRRSEIILLTWDRVDLVSRIITLTDDDVKTGSTTGGREIPINDIVFELLLERLNLLQELQIKTQFVFPNFRDSKRAMSVNGFKTTWAKVVSLAGLTSFKYTWHDFRATFEKYMHKASGFTDTQREKMAGANINVQKRIYVSMDADDLRGLEKAVNIPGLKDVLTGKTRGEYES